MDSSLNRTGKHIGHRYNCPCGNRAIAKNAGCWVCARCLKIETRNEYIAKQREELKQRQAIFFNQ